METETQMEPKLTKEQKINVCFALIVMFQFVLPGLLTVIVSSLKLIGLILVGVPWIYVLLPLTVSVAVGVALLSLILLNKVFEKAFGK